MNIETKAEAYEHGVREHPREACGLLIVEKGREKYVPCRNLASGTEHFLISPEDYAAAEERGEIVGVFHSHPNAQPTPSQADRVACEASGLPWFIVGVPNAQWAEIAPVGYKAPLIGRVFCHGVLDCYTLIRDWYNYERGVTLPDYERRDEWWKQGGNLYLENFKSAGFVETDELHEGAVLLMQVVSKVPNHAAIYLGDNLIVHHLQGRLSSRDIYGGYWRKITNKILRYARN